MSDNLKPMTVHMEGLGFIKQHYLVDPFWSKVLEIKPIEEWVIAVWNEPVDFNYGDKLDYILYDIVDGAPDLYLFDDIYEEFGAFIEGLTEVINRNLMRYLGRYIDYYVIATNLGNNNDIYLITPIPGTPHNTTTNSVHSRAYQEWLELMSDY